MKRNIIVANWKSNKTESEAKTWLDRFKISGQEFASKEVIICPPSTLLSLISSEAKNRELKVKVGAQDISPFGEGAYTGAINGRQIKELASYVIIGHSERRKNFGETDEMLFDKFKLAKENGLNVIYCVQGKNTRIPANVDIVAYEPIDAIGTGHPDTPGNANDVAVYFKTNYKVPCVLYGGSVTSLNVNNFTQMPDIDGVLIGRASLDAKEFYTIIKNA